jgi:hypothetical protein
LNTRKRTRRDAPKKAYIQKAKVFPVAVDPLQLEFIRLRKDVGSNFKKVESVANSIKTIERQSRLADPFASPEQQKLQM